jgi:3-hydroxyacyl-CoA dehydrogenase
MSVPKVAAVIGAGPMGPGMAAVLARAGSKVRLYDISTGSTARCAPLSAGTPGTR